MIEIARIEDQDGKTLVTFVGNEPRPITLTITAGEITIADISAELLRVQNYALANQHPLVGQTVVVGPDLAMFMQSVATTFGTAQAGAWLDTLKATVRALDSRNFPLARVSLNDALAALVIDVTKHGTLVQLGIDAGLWSA